MTGVSMLPPALAPYQVVIVPIGRGADATGTQAAATELATELQRGWHPHARGRPAAAVTGLQVQ